MFSGILSDIISFFGSEESFRLAAYVGTGLILRQVICNLFGWVDSDDVGDFNEAVEYKNFKFISLQAVAPFLMMFGWTGMTCQKEFHLSLAASVKVSLLAGAASGYITRLIFKLSKFFHSPGNSCNLDDIIGKEATVYQRIPKGGTGKISISFEHLTCEVDAVSATQEEISSFTRVQILKKTDGSTLVVMPIKK